MKNTKQFHSSLLLFALLTIQALSFSTSYAHELSQKHNIADYDFVNLRKYIPSIFFDIIYATTNNFTGKKLYPSDACYLRRGTADKLRAVVKELLEQGYSVVIIDAYRPLSVQKILWSIVPDNRYVANPAKGSRHNRGAAVDLCLVKSDGSQLPQQTPIDDLTERAHRNNKNISDDVKKTRTILDTAMTHHGFVGMPTEWWHFDDNEYQKYPIEDKVF